jgi:hypothetical protein
MQQEIFKLFIYSTQNCGDGQMFKINGLIGCKFAEYGRQKVKNRKHVQTCNGKNEKERLKAPPLIQLVGFLAVFAQV